MGGRGFYFPRQALKIVNYVPALAERLVSPNLPGGGVLSGQQTCTTQSERPEPNKPKLAEFVFTPSTSYGTKEFLRNKTGGKRHLFGVKKDYRGYRGAGFL